MSQYSIENGIPIESHASAKYGIIETINTDSDKLHMHGPNPNKASSVEPTIGIDSPDGGSHLTTSGGWTTNRYSKDAHIPLDTFTWRCEVKMLHDMITLPMGMEECSQLMGDLMELPVDYILSNRGEFEKRIYFLVVGFAETGIDDFTVKDEPLVAKFADWLDDTYRQLGSPDKSIANDFRLILSQ